ncbi:NYN domain-containing protein [Patescibacteria group bacterium]|nr:NYN domain-containing protein [Patescibacteria group bacterium]
MRGNNFAYIDGNNLYKGVKNCGWSIDFARFRKWLADKFHVERAYYFIGMISKEKDLYVALQKAGFTLIFKEVVYDGLGKPKGNCDADLVLQSVIDAFENNCENQILVSSDGDYSGLAKFLHSKNKLRGILSPSNSDRCSILLKRLNVPIIFLNDVRKKVRLKEKAPVKDETLKGSFS